MSKLENLLVRLIGSLLKIAYVTRYIEVYKSSMEEAARAYARQSGGGNVMEAGGGGTGYGMEYEDRGMMGMGGMGMGGMVPGRGMMGPVGKYVLKAKGLPFRATQMEIAEVLYVSRWVGDGGQGCEW